MKSIAIIGSGIAGLGSAYLLHRDFDIQLFEQNHYAGGHTNTVTVREGEREVPIDTGFMVFNEVTYPNLTRLFAELGVDTFDTSMSFGVQHVASGIEYAGGGVNQLFAQRRNVLRPRFLRTLARIDRFNREAHAALAGETLSGLTLQQYSDAHGYGEDFLELYLLPMASAIWSTPFDDIRGFPAVPMLRFFRNHGLLGGLSGQHQWKTVAGGAKTYVEKMTRGFRDRIHLGNPVRSVRREATGAVLHFAEGPARRFDRVIFACQADQALALLDAPTADERRLLGAFRYQPNVATLHTDVAPMPRERRAWASWNYRFDRKADGRVAASTIYWMNSLQNVSERQNYFVSIDDPGLIDPARVLRTIAYRHPVFTVDAIEAQRELPSLNAIGPEQTTYFCGSYFRWGFHEDAFTSAIRASRALSAQNGVRPAVEELAA